MKKLSAASLGYLAGIIDGEGCLSLRRKTTPKSVSVISYVVITNTDKRLMDWLHKNLEGKTYTILGRFPNKTVYVWYAKSTSIIMILESILPYLILKKEQAKILIKFRKTLGPAGKPTEARIKALRNKLARRMKKLNKRGEER